MLMLCLFFLYNYIISPKIDKIFPKSFKLVNFTNGDEKKFETTGEGFDYGAWVHSLGKKAWGIPKQIAEAATKNMSN